LRCATPAWYGAGSEREGSDPVGRCHGRERRAEPQHLRELVAAERHGHGGAAVEASGMQNADFMMPFSGTGL